MWFFIVSIVSVILFRWIPIPVTPLMLIRCVEHKMDGKEMKLNKDWVSLDEIAPSLQLAVVCSEDQNFIKHNGFDFEAIEKAMDYNETHTKTRGASTISQQTAKNVFLWQGRSFIRKGFEVYFTFNAGKPSAYTQKRRAWVMNQMSLWGGVLRYEEVEGKPVKKKKRK